MRKTIVITAAIAAATLTAQAKEWSLNECVNYALEHNISLQQKKITKLTAEQTTEAAEAQWLPSLSASTSQNVGWQPWKGENQNTVQNGQAVSSVDKTYYNGTYGINANWTVWDGNQRQNNIKLDKLAEQVAELDSATTANSIQEQIIQYYVQILYTIEAVEVSKEALESAKANEQRGKTMVEVGSMSKADLAQLTAQTAQTEYDLVSQQSNLRNYKRQLKQLLQITDEEEFDVQSPGASDAQALQTIPALRTVYEQALLTRPEIEMAKLGVEEQELNIKIAKAGILPTVGLSGSVGTNTTSLSSDGFGSQLKTNFSGAAGVTVSVPLFDQKKTKTAVNKARLQQQSKILELREQETALWSDIEKYWLDATLNQEKFKSAKVNSESAQTSYDLLAEQFKLGLKNIVELRTGKDNLLSAKQSELQSKYTAILNIQMLKFYKGEPLTL